MLLSNGTTYVIERRNFSPSFPIYALAKMAFIQDVIFFANYTFRCFINIKGKPGKVK